MRKIYSTIVFLLAAIQLCLAQDFMEIATTSGLVGGCGHCPLGTGVSFVDFNGDGLDDITFATGEGANVLFFQNTGSGFIEIPAPITNTSRNEMVVWVDFDNDGDKDLFVTSFEAPNRLYENDGNLNLTDITSSAGLPIDNAPSYGAVFGDYNNDGWLDLYLDNWSYQGVYTNYLYKNNGDGTFSDVTEDAGVADDYELTFMSAFLDINNNGLQDLYNSQDRYWSINSMFKNNGDDTFDDISSSSNTDIEIDAMNVGVGDYDNDGDLDIYVTNISTQQDGNALLRNNGDETFTDVAGAMGVDMFQVTWGGNFFDADNDLDLDLYVSAQHVGSEFSSKLFINNNGNSFTEANPPGMQGDTMNSYSNAIGDFNLDGLMDIVVNNATPLNGDFNNFHLWQNTSSNSNNWLKVFLVGTDSNRDGIGSWIEMYINGNKYVRYKHCGIAYLAQNSTLEHFGMGPFTQADSVIVRWLSGNADVLYDVTANQILTIVEGSSPLINCDNANIPPPAGMDEAICEGDAIPELVVTADPGLEVYWYGNPTGGPLLASSTLVYTPSGPGTYWTETRDPASGCSSDTRTPITLTVNENPSVWGGLNEFACLGTPVTFVAETEGGDGNYSYAWTDGLSFTNTLTVAPPVHTSYTVTVTDGNGCQDTDVVTAVVYELPAVTAGDDATICDGDCVTLSAIGSEGQSPYEYNWSGGSEEVCPNTTTTYTVTVTDDNGCTATDEQTVNVLPTPFADAGEDISVCLNDCFTFDPTATGGVEPYTFSWSGDEQETVCPEATTTYTLTVTGDNGCASTDEIKITVNELPVVNAGTDISLCLGECYTFAPSSTGGSGEYQYTWSSGTEEVCPTETTTYSVTVTDSNGCSATDEITITINELPVVNAGTDVSLCLGECYTFTPSATGGGGGYQYTWSSGTEEVCPTETTTYSVTVTDSNGCSSTDEITITINELPVVNAGTDISLCVGECYTFVPSSTGGSGGYQYTWSSGTEEVCPTETTTYSVTVTDSNGCASTDEIMITVNELPVVNAGTDVSLCLGECYTFAPSSTGGSGGYQYTWSSGTEEVCPTQTTTYSVTVTDSNGCSATDEITITVNELPTVNAGEDIGLCLGECYTFTPSSTGGSGGYQYTWSSGSAEVCPTQTTTYTVTVTDSNGCSATDEITITVHELPVADAGGDEALCLGDCFTFTPAAGGGQPPYNYSWSGDGSTTVCPTQTTAYTLTVTDAVGCSSTDAITILVNPLPVVELGADVVICEGSCYTFDAQTTSGTAPYSYAWSSGTSEVCPTETTTYSVTVTDANGCSNTDAITVFVAELPTVNAGDDVSICAGECFTFNPNAFGGSGGYEYAWSSGSEVVCPTETTTYTVTLTDSNGCTSTDEITINVVEAPMVNAGTDLSICLGECYTFDASAGGGQPPYDYSWSSGTNEVCPSQTTTYTLTVTDAIGCSSTDEITITVNDLPMVELGEDVVICAGECITLTPTVSGGGGDYQYTWSGGSAQVCPAQTTTYSVTVTDNNDCSAEDAITVFVAPLPQVEAGMDVNLCPGGCYTFDPYASGGTGPYAFEWDAPATTVCPTQSETYSVTLTDANGCTATDELTINLLPELTVTAGEDTAICSGTCYSLSAAGSGGTGSYTYVWSSGEVMVCPEQTTTYTVTITDTEGCSAVDEMTIIVHTPTDAITQLHEMCIGDCVTYSASDFDLTTFMVDGQMTGEVTFCEGGSYNIEALDENLCSTSVNFSITQTAPPQALAGSDQVLTCAMTEVILGQNTAQPGITFQWSNGVNTPVQTVDQTGVYILTATNTALSCGTTDTVTVTIDTLLPLADAGADLELTCASPTLPANGSGSSQGDEYTYAWTTTDGNILNGANTLTPEMSATGLYVLSVSNTINGCTAQDELLVTQAEEPGLEIVQVMPADCHDEATGSITVAGQGGTPIYSYAWSHGATTTSANNLEAGTYTVTLTDANGCEVTQSIEVTEPPAIVLALSATAETSSLAADGSISAAVSGGTPGYAYLWSTGATTPMIADLSPELYYITVTDQNGCIAIDSARVNSFDCQSISTQISQNNYICPGSNAGSITIEEISGGESPYSILWSTMSSETNITDLEGGHYSATITDANNCEVILQFDVTEEDTISPTLITEDITLYLNDAGEASYTAAMIDGGSSDNCSAVSFELPDTALSCEHLGVNTHEVKLWDENGNYDSTSVQITVMDTISPVFTICPEDMISLNCLAVIYEVPVASDNCAVETIEQIEGLASGVTFPEGSTTVRYQAVDASGNEAQCSFTITVQNTLEVTAAVSAYSCDPQAPYTASLTASGGTQGYTYVWQDGVTTAETLLSAPGPWSWTVTDSQGCEQTGAIDLPIPDTMSITLDATAATNMEQNGAIDATVSGGSGSYGYQWFDGNGTLFSTTEDLDQIPAGNYCLQVTDEYECIAQACVEVENITSTINSYLEQRIYLSPNPASDELKVTFDLQEQQSATMILMDISGQEIWRQQKEAAREQVMVSMGAYAEGVYLMKIIIGNNLVVKKVVVSR